MEETIPSSETEIVGKKMARYTHLQKKKGYALLEKIITKMVNEERNAACTAVACAKISVPLPAMAIPMHTPIRTELSAHKQASFDDMMKKAEAILDPAKKAETIRRIRTHFFPEEAHS